MFHHSVHAKKQLIGLVVTALALQGVLSLVGYWGFYSLQPLLLWAIRAFLIFELVVWTYSAVKHINRPLPLIGKYAEKAF